MLQPLLLYRVGLIHKETIENNNLQEALHFLPVPGDLLRK
jgi:hypothetical protein